MSIELVILEKKAEQALEKENFLASFEYLKEAHILAPENRDILERAIFLAKYKLDLPEEIIKYGKLLVEIEPDNVALYGTIAFAFYDVGDGAAGLIETQKGLDLAEDRDDILYLKSARGLCNYLVNRFEEAVADFEVAVVKYENWVAGHANLGWSYFMLDEYSKAVDSLTAAISLADEIYPYAHGGRGLALYELSQYDLAAEDLTIGLEENASWARGYATRGWCYLEIEYVQDKYALALADFNKVISLADTEADEFAYYGRAVVYYNLREYQKTVADAKVAIRLNKNAYHAYDILGWAYLKNNQPLKARETFDNYLSLTNKPDFSSLSGRGEAKYELDLIDEALIDFRAAEKYDIKGKEEPRIQLLIAWCLFEKAETESDYEDVVECFTKAMALQDSGYAHGGRGLAYYMQNNYDLALADLNIALAQNPNWLRGLAYRAWIFSENGTTDQEFEQGLADAKKALADSEGEYDFAQAAQSVLLSKLGHYQEAMPQLDRALANNADWLEGLWHKGTCCYELGRYQEGIIVYSKIIKQLKDSWTAYHMRALMYVKDKQYKKAKADNKKAIALGGPSCSQGNLAEMYFYGQGMILPNVKKAYKLLEVAYANQQKTKDCGCITSKLINCYYKGLGTKRNLKKVKMMLEELTAAEKADEEVSLLLAYFYVQGDLFFQKEGEALGVVVAARVTAPKSCLLAYYDWVLSENQVELKRLQALELLDQLEEDFVEIVTMNLTNKLKEIIYPIK
ncbi:MAG: tetratricopeptide repeat protein [Culicoidibacterales bacterium]